MLVEREDELAALRDTLADAVRGWGSVALIRGPLGIGKSALLEEIATVADGLAGHLLSVDVTPDQRDHAFAAVTGLLRPVLGSGEPPEPSDVLRDLIERREVDAPVVMLIDDLQWMDDSSLNWLRRCALEGRRMPVAIIATMREGDPAADRLLVREFVATAGTTIDLRPLSVDGTEAMLGSLFYSGIGAEFTEAGYEASGGVPLLVDALCHDLTCHGLPVRPDRLASGLAVRSWQLRERLAAALRATPLAWECATAIVVLAERADPSLIAPLIDSDPRSVAMSCDFLRRLGVLARTDPLRFAADAWRELVGELMDVGDYGLLHLRAARVLHDQGFPAEEVIERLLETPHGAEVDWVVEEIRATADTAVEQGEPRRAARYLRWALGEDERDRARLLTDLALAETRFDVTAALRHVGEAMDLLPGRQERAEALAMLPSTAFRTTRSSRGAALVERVDAEQGELTRLASLRLAARRSYTSCEDPAAVAEAVRQIEALTGEPGLATVAERELLAVQLYIGTVSAGVGAGRIAELAEHLLWREPASCRRGYSTATLALTALIAAGAPKSALQWLDSALELAEYDQPIELERAILLCQRAVSLGHLGQLGLARSTAWQALRLLDGDLTAVAEIPVMALAAVAMITRDVRLAAEVVAGSAELIELDLGLHARASLLMLRGTLAAADDDPSGALDHFLACGVALANADWQNPVLFPWLSWAVRLQRQLGDLDAALLLADEECAQARRWGAPGPIGRALRGKASVVSQADGLELLAEAVDTLRSSADRTGLAKALLDHGSALRAAGSPAADERLSESYSVATSCGAQWVADSAVAAGWSQDGGPPDRAGRLTEAERRVAELAIRGLTNAEIATALVVTRRAVEKNLTSYYRKVGVSGRSDLAGVFDGHVTMP